MFTPHNPAKVQRSASLTTVTSFETTGEGHPPLSLQLFEKDEGGGAISLYNEGQVFLTFPLAALDAIHGLISAAHEQHFSGSDVLTLPDDFFLPPSTPDETGL